MRIGFPHRSAPTGGPGTFQERFISELHDYGHTIVYPDSHKLPEVVFVFLGTRRLDWLWKCKRDGATIIHRLDGINWRHKVQSKGIYKNILSVGRNKLMNLIRCKIADKIIYQSNFVKKRWISEFGDTDQLNSVIRNGTDTNIFRPNSQYEDNNSERKCSIICVEGEVQNDEITLSTAEKVASMNVVKEMMVVGKVEERTKRRLMQHPKIRVFGEVHRKRIPELLRQANLYLCLEINPPCPNAVIEALATGLPVLGFDTGALKELVSDQAGCVVPYDADPWKLEMPNFSSLTNGFDTIYRNLSSYAEAARARAVNKFDIRDVTKEYINFALIQGSSNAT